MAWGKKSGRTAPLPPGWGRIRSAVLARDAHACVEIRGDTGERCGAHATDVDHIGPADDHSLENLRSLCSYHHARKTGRQGGKARGKKTGGYHPGLKPL